MKRNIVLLAIIVIAVFLRFYKLGLNPPSLYWDETINCYDAYSLSQTGKDHHAVSWPITHLISYGDYKNPLYTYLTILPVKLFGLNEFSCRFPSAFFGVLTVFILYFLTYELLKNNKIALLSTLLLAISPWHLQFSRAGFEANINLFLIVLGIFLFLKAINRLPIFFILSAVIFSLTPYAYHSSKLLMPILVILLLLIYIKQAVKNFKWVILAGIIGIIVIYPLTTKQARKAVLYRFTEINIFNEEDVVLKSNQLREADHWSFISNLFHNRRIYYAQKFLKHYFDHFQFDYLFLTGDKNIRHSTQAVGEFYLIEFPFLLLGFYYFIKNKDKRLLIVFVWLLLSLIPASFTVATPHAIRTLSGLGSWQIIIAYGFINLVNNIKKLNYRVFFLATCYLLLTTSVIYYLHFYYVHYPKIADLDWQYGYKQIIGYIKDNQDKYQKIIVSDRYGRAYGYLLFYLKYPPEKIQQEILLMNKKNKKFTGSFGKYIIADPNGNFGSNVLKTGAPDEFPNVTKSLFIVNSLNNKPIFWAVAD